MHIATGHRTQEANISSSILSIKECIGRTMCQLQLKSNFQVVRRSEFVHGAVSPTAELRKPIRRQEPKPKAERRYNRSQNYDILY